MDYYFTLMIILIISQDGYIGAPRYFLQGVVSIGLTGVRSLRPSSCFNVSIFTKVYPFVSWIHQQIKSMTPRPPKRTTARTTVPTQPPFPDYAETALALHNQLRLIYRAPALTLNPQLQQAAKDWANYLVNNNFQVGPNPSNYGQNYYEYISSIPLTSNDLTRKAVDSWYAQNLNYDPTNPSSSLSSMFSQLVWRGTREMGIFIATQGQRSILMVMYNPRGNIPGQFEENVYIPSGLKPPTTAPPPPSTPSTGTYYVPVPYNSNYAQLAMDLHNSYRSRHGVPPLTLDPQLSIEAQNYADFVTRNNFVLQPKYASPYGQNIFENDGKVLDPSDAVRKAVDRWYDGRFGYNWLNPMGSAPVGYLFSQVVWKLSSSIGVGVSSGNRRTVVICFYSPPGNVQSIESYKENVLPSIL